MNPNATLAEMRRLAGEIASNEHTTGTMISTAYRLAELALALDEWITRGGALPEEWGTKKPALRPLPFGDLSEEERELLRMKILVSAIKMYRMRTGCSLLDAKNAIDTYSARNAL